MPCPKNEYSFDSIVTYKFVDMISNESMDPNIITAINIIPSILSLYFLHMNNYIFFFVFLFIRLILDCLDGHVARKYNKVSEFGNYFDHYTDLVYYVLLIIFLTYKINIIIMILLTSVLILLLKNYIVKFEFFQFIEDNSVISIPLISLIFIYFQNNQNQ